MPSPHILMYCLLASFDKTAAIILGWQNVTTTLLTSSISMLTIVNLSGCRCRSATSSNFAMVRCSWRQSWLHHSCLVGRSSFADSVTFLRVFAIRLPKKLSPGGAFPGWSPCHKVFKSCLFTLFLLWIRSSKALLSVAVIGHHVFVWSNAPCSAKSRARVPTCAECPANTGQWRAIHLPNFFRGMACTIRSARISSRSRRLCCVDLCACLACAG